MSKRTLFVLFLLGVGGFLFLTFFMNIGGTAAAFTIAIPVAIIFVIANMRKGGALTERGFLGLPKLRMPEIESDNEVPSMNLSARSMEPREARPDPVKKE